MKSPKCFSDNSPSAGGQQKKLTYNINTSILRAQF